MNRERRVQELQITCICQAYVGMPGVSLLKLHQI